MRGAYKDYKLKFPVKHESNFLSTKEKELKCAFMFYVCAVGWVCVMHAASVAI